MEPASLPRQSGQRWQRGRLPASCFSPFYPTRAFLRAPDFHILKYAKCVGYKDRDRVVGAHEIGDDGLLVDTHKADGQTRLVFVGNAGLVQTSDALALLARAE